MTGRNHNFDIRGGGGGLEFLRLRGGGGMFKKIFENNKLRITKKNFLKLSFKEAYCRIQRSYLKCIFNHHQTPYLKYLKIIYCKKL